MTYKQIPKKPTDVTWTDDQWVAMHAQGRDILVAAAAGSGKTAVLVERIIRKITDPIDPLDVDELLVVTFTNAAAAEMRNRIGQALEGAIDEAPDSAHLRKQLSLLNRASISTLHSFCQEVIRKYYYLIDIDPGFRIAEETEAQLIRDDVIVDLFEEEYSKPDNERFLTVVDSFTSDRSDVALETIILELYDFAQANPDPDRWLQQITAIYDVHETMQMEDLPFIGPVLETIDLQLAGAKQLLEGAYALTSVPGGPAPREETYRIDLQLVEQLMIARDQGWGALYETMQGVKFSRAKTCRGDMFDKEILDEATRMRDEAKEIVTEMKNKFFWRAPVRFLQDMREMSVHMEVLAQLVRSFSERFAEAKKEKGLADFADLEHNCLRILKGENGPGNKDGRSDAARAYRRRFKEVYVDEYQDTNMVQEAIIQLVTEDEEASGNLFMVGDVKQSIYRFRLAEPNLFLNKYKRFVSLEKSGGLRIDLAKNFRSRQEVLDCTNYIFKQIMDPQIGEIAYDDAAALEYGAAYPTEAFPVEVCLIDQAEREDSQTSFQQVDGSDSEFDGEDLAQSQLEAQVIAEEINKLIQEKRPIYNPKTKTSRPIVYRDIVILLRSMTWAPEIIEELKGEGIPVYANLSSGYFEAPEINIMMSLLQIIDNPLQDIPLAAVLRSPIVQLEEGELAKIRLTKRDGSFYEAMQAFLKENIAAGEEGLFVKVAEFNELLQGWREMSRRGGLSQLIWQLYRDTRFYDYVGGLPGGKQRQANLAALHDRARQYEKTSFRGLFRFLRFVERMRDRGDDLGAARALSEQEDVVRMMTIHSSKGLEFPVVFVGGLGRSFNKMDLNKSYLLDKDFGMATKYVDVEKQIRYDSLPELALKTKKEKEMIAEEMRVLYVALTRAKEKLYFIATTKDLEKEVAKWQRSMTKEGWLLEDYERTTAKSYLDWLGRAFIRHEDFSELHQGIETSVPMEIASHRSAWKLRIIPSRELAYEEKVGQEMLEQHLHHVQKSELVPIVSQHAAEVKQRLAWIYPSLDATRHRSKQSVSEVKRQHELRDVASGTDLIMKARRPLADRPNFMQVKKLSAAERGTALHKVMQYIPLDEQINDLQIALLLEEMVEKELLIEEEREVIIPEEISRFFETDLGRRLLKAEDVRREVPFSMAMPASEVYADWKKGEEKVLIQGMIDCLFFDERGLVLLDYKTDRITGRFKGGFSAAQPILEDRYRVQIDMYAKAVEQILQKDIRERYLYFFDGSHVLKM